MIGEDKHGQVQTASATAATPSAEQVIGNEDKNQSADVIANKQPTHNDVEATQATDKATPDASGASVSNEVDTAKTQETTPTKAIPEPELGEDPTPSPPPPDAPAPPPVPEKDTTATNEPPSTSEETSASPSHTADPAPTKVEDANKTEEPSAQPTEPEAPATEKADGAKSDAVEEAPKPQSDADGDNHAVGEGSATRDDDGKADAATTKLTLLTDRVRELSTASIMSASSSAPGTPAEDVASSAVDDEEDVAPEQGGPSSKSKKKKSKSKKKKNKGEKNSPHPPSAETVRHTDNSTIQDRNPPPVAITAPVDIPIVDGEGELVEKEASGEEDSPVIVDKVDSSGEEGSAVKVERPQGEAGKAADASGDSSTDEWFSWND